MTSTSTETYLNLYKTPKQQNPSNFNAQSEEKTRRKKMKFCRWFLAVVAAFCTIALSDAASIAHASNSDVTNSDVTNSDVMKLMRRIQVFFMRFLFLIFHLFSRRFKRGFAQPKRNAQERRALIHSNCMGRHKPRITIPGQLWATDQNVLTPTSVFSGFCKKIVWCPWAEHQVVSMGLAILYFRHVFGCYLGDTPTPCDVGSVQWNKWYKGHLE